MKLTLIFFSITNFIEEQEEEGGNEGGGDAVAIEKMAFDAPPVPQTLALSEIKQVRTRAHSAKKECKRRAASSNSRARSNRAFVSLSS